MDGVSIESIIGVTIMVTVRAARRLTACVRSGSVFANNPITNTHWPYLLLTHYSRLLAAAFDSNSRNHATVTKKMLQRSVLYILDLFFNKNQIFCGASHQRSKQVSCKEILYMIVCIRIPRMTLNKYFCHESGQG